MLEKMGFSVETAPDGKEAIEMYKQSMDAGNPFDVVIMDLTIPGGIGGRKLSRKYSPLILKSGPLFPADMPMTRL